MIKLMYGAPTAPGQGRDVIDGLVDKVKEIMAPALPDHHRVTWRGIELTWTGSVFTAILPSGVSVRALPDGARWIGQIAIRGGVTEGKAAGVVEALDAAVTAWRETLDQLGGAQTQDPKAEGPC